MKRIILFLCVVVMCVSGCETEVRQLARVDDVAAAFGEPHDSTRTKVWWFHGETETTREGVTADLEAYRHAGVGGVVYYDQVHNKKTPDALPAFSPEWWEMLLFSAREAERLGLTFECHVSNGFVAGGPWVTPDMAMQRLAAVDTVVSGGREIELQLPRPATGYYKDVAVLAFPRQEGRCEDSREVKPVLSSNVEGLDVEAIFAPGKVLTRIPVPDKGEAAYLYLDFGRDFTARSITYQVAPRGKATTSATNVPAPPGDVFVGTGYQVLPPLGQLEVSDDGLHYRPVCDLKPIYKAHSSWRQKTVAFPAVTARYFRLNLHDWTTPDRPALHMQLGDVSLSARACVDVWEEKAGLYSEYVEPDETPEYASAEVIDPASIVDLTRRLDVDGVLRWEVPAGEWTVLRFAHVPTGGKTKHGRPNLMGPECDKMSVAAAELQWNRYFGAIADTLARHGVALHGMAMDSHEAGSQNWTPGFDRAFASRRGYDMLRYLPVMAGYVVGSSQESNAFLYDVRRTIADLIADNYYATFDRLCRERGLDFTAQATGNALCIVADPIQAKGRVSKPQGEFWAIHPDGNYDIKECSSAAHLYGKPVASGEAFTDARFSHSLADIKSLADYAYCFGLNEFVVCASAYQPWLDREPGNTGGGRHYCLHRNNTYWPYSREFWDYQSRASYVMRQGRPVIDLAVYLGENAPVKILTHRLPDVPSGYDFDAFTTDALFTRMAARDGRIVLPDGMSYRMMVLPRSGELTLAALRQIASFVAEGVPVYGTRPVGSPAREDIGREAEYDRLVSDLWGAESLPQGSNSYGKGRVWWGMSLADAVTEAGLRPDMAMKHGDVKADKIYYTHRALADADIYFLDNHPEVELVDTFTFRTVRRAAELWNPVDGRRYRLSLSSSDTASVSLSLHLAPRESYFIVFSDRISPDNLPRKVWPGSGREEIVEGSWSVCFSPERGGPGWVVFPTLTDWTTHADPRIRYYSGTAVYHRSMMIHRATPGEQVFLRLNCLGGAVKVVVNGREVETVWCSPWEADITEAVRDGENQIELHVVNSLMNCMIGDASLPEEKRYTYAYPVIATPDEPLVPSGLVAPLVLEYRVE